MARKPLARAPKPKKACTAYDPVSGNSYTYLVDAPPPSARCLQRQCAYPSCHCPVPFKK